MKHLLSVHIIWKFIDTPWGGGNQFLKALKQQFTRQGIYSDEPEKADIILFNSHQFQKQTLKLKLKYPNKIFVHRVDGPLSQTRGKNSIMTDKKIFYSNRLIADGTIFQSHWSREESYRLGMTKNSFETCIANAPDPNIFYPTSFCKKNRNLSGKIRLITTTWSSNQRKGFDIYHYLDEHLDFKKYSMTFVGNFDKPFKKINTIPPVPSKDLASMLRSHDIFIAASKYEPCSNSFLEALHCGLPAIARNNSSYPELLSGNGLLFENEEDILKTIDRLAQKLDAFKQKIRIITLDEIAERYYRFFESVQNSIDSGDYKPKKLSPFTYCCSRLMLKNI